MESVAALMNDRSGSRFSVRGVGTQTMMSSHSATSAKSTVARRRPLVTRPVSVSEVTSLMYESPALMRSTRGASGSTQSTACPASAKATASGRPT